MTPVPTLPRDALFRALNGDSRLVAAFEQQAKAVDETQDVAALAVDATDALQDATVLTLSANATFNNERVLKLGEGIQASDDGTYLTLSVDDDVPHVVGGFRVALTAQGETVLVLPLEGILATLAGNETLSNKLLASVRLTASEYTSDAAAGAGGVPVGGLYLKSGAVYRRAS